MYAYIENPLAVHDICSLNGIMKSNSLTVFFLISMDERE